MTDDRRLIEDYLPIQAISAEASREKSVRKGHISTLHLWWARRPLVACRAAVYGALVPASQFMPNAASDEKKKSLGRANAAKFIERLCQYPGSPDVIQEAQQHILKAHAARLTLELRSSRREEAHSSREANQSPVTSADKPPWVAEYRFHGETVSVEDIVEGRAPRPKVLDMFAGGGAIPLEALRLGCEAYALDLNPVAHIIQLCTLVYPQKFGKPDPKAKGSAKDGTWAGLAAEVEYWGKWVLDKVKAEIGDLYPPIPDPEASGEELGSDPQATMGFAQAPQQRLKVKRGFLTPVAYLWTRTVRCKNPACGATVPLVKQTWMRKKAGSYVALRLVAPPGSKRVRFEVVEASTPAALGFDPRAFSKAGNATCPFCGTVADSTYVKEEGMAKRLGYQLMATACSRSQTRGKAYLAADGEPDETDIGRRIKRVCDETGLSVPTEPIVNDAKGALFCVLYGFDRWSDVFSPRQMLCLLTFAKAVREGQQQMVSLYEDTERAKAVSTLLAVIHDRLADFSSTLCVWNCIEGERTAHTFGRQALPMTWDFSETAPFNEENAGWPVAIERIVPAIASVDFANAGRVERGSAMTMSYPTELFDAVVTDPPYYDNVPYADISDFFYVWLKRTVSHLYPEHFAAAGTPKKSEAVADATRHDGDRNKARMAVTVQVV